MHVRVVTAPTAPIEERDMTNGIAITGPGTWAFKLVLPGLLIALFVFVYLYDDHDLYSRMLGATASRVIGGLMIVGFTALAVAASRQLRTVWLFGDEVEIGDWFRHVRVPLREVTGLEIVYTLKLNHRHPVRMTYALPSGVATALFLPRSRREFPELEAAWQRARADANPSAEPEAAAAHLAMSLRHRKRIVLPGLPGRR